MTGDQPFRRAFLAGWPVRHSRSPLIHGTWLRERGIAGEYVLEEVAPENFARFLAEFADRGYVGGNVTIPHKLAAARAVERLEPAAERLGAVNTVWLEDGRLCGANTDVHGFLANLDELAAGWDADLETAAVLGAGGAARAVVYALLERGVGRVRVVNRTPERTAGLAGEFGSRVVAVEWGDWRHALAGAGLLVNATSLGMSGTPGPDADLRFMPARAVVNDLVYVPLETPLLARARALGLVAVDGLGMLLHQAVPGFEKWFGVRPAVTPRLRRLVVADLERR